jgi:hypothetical protein
MNEFIWLWIWHRWIDKRRKGREWEYKKQFLVAIFPFSEALTLARMRGNGCGERRNKLWRCKM